MVGVEGPPPTTRTVSGDHEPGSGRHGGHGDGEPAAEPDAEGAEDGIVITHRSGSHMVVDLFV